MEPGAAGSGGRSAVQHAVAGCLQDAQRRVRCVHLRGRQQIRDNQSGHLTGDGLRNKPRIAETAEHRQAQKLKVMGPADGGNFCNQCGCNCWHVLSCWGGAGCRHRRVRARCCVHWCGHQENRKALVGLATRPDQSQTRANKTKTDQKHDQSTRGPLFLKPEVGCVGFVYEKLTRAPSLLDLLMGAAAGTGVCTCVETGGVASRAAMRPNKDVVRSIVKEQLSRTYS
jgi:hypothetical protein